MSYHSPVDINISYASANITAKVAVREEYRRRVYYIGKDSTLTIDRITLMKLVKAKLSRDDIAALWNQMGLEQEQAIKEAYDNWNMTEECVI